MSSSLVVSSSSLPNETLRLHAGMRNVCRDWNMVLLATRMFFRGRHVGLGGVLRTWLPFCLILSVVAILAGVLGGTV